MVSNFIQVYVPTHSSQIYLRSCKHGRLVCYRSACHYIGTIAIDASWASNMIPNATDPQDPRYQGWALSSDGAWITYNSARWCGYLHSISCPAQQCWARRSASALDLERYRHAISRSITFKVLRIFTLISRHKYFILLLLLYFVWGPGSRLEYIVG